MAISSYLTEQELQNLLEQQFAENQGIIGVLPSNVSPFFRMDATSGAFPLQDFRELTGPQIDFGSTLSTPVLASSVPTIQNPGTSQSLGFDTSFGVADENDEEQIEFLGSKPSGLKQGIGKLFELFQKVSPVAAFARGLNSLRNKFDTQRAIREDIARDTQGGPITTFRNLKQQEQDRIDDRNRGQIPSRSPAPSRPSTTYQDAKTAFTSGR
jgi:hypothetical protein